MSTTGPREPTAGELTYSGRAPGGTVAPPVNELRALSRLTFDELSGVPGGIGQVHRAVADRAFWAVGPLGSPAKAAHDAVARRVYAAARDSAAWVGRAADIAIERRRLGDGRTLSTTPRGSALMAALNGLIGDSLERQGSELAQPMSIRIAGEPVAPTADALAQGLGRVTPWPVIFLHGLMETEFSWRLGSQPEGRTYGDRLAQDLGCTPVYVRYNSGLHISQNGRSLDALIQAVFEAWPVEIEQLALIGHSMGGLVARSACWHGGERKAQWTRSVRHVVSLGTPHMGAPLEQAVHLASATLGALPETRPFGAFLRRRSAGIRDLHQGSLVDEDWEGRNPDALRVAACREIALLDNATHCFVSASVTRSPKHPLGRLIGDTLVLVPSASGRSRSRRLPFKDEHGVHIGGTHHFALLNHPVIYRRLERWLSTPPTVLAQVSPPAGDSNPALPALPPVPGRSDGE